MNISYLKYPFERKGDDLVIAFSSSPEVFEWTKVIPQITEGFPIDVFYIMDKCNVWWHGIYPEFGGNGPLNISKFLKDKILDMGYKRVMTIGASRGGYGAILIGCLLNVDLVLSFSPQTDLIRSTNRKYGVLDRIKELEKNVEGFNIDRNLINLKEVILSYGKDNKTIYKIFYGEYSYGDTRHAKNLEGIRNIYFFTTESKSHKVLKIFLNDGTILKEIQNFTSKEI